jgi:hypothetical protein|tara:strand:- start:60 stop:278 length:219 start_codon:yes stop_codon:yes gene_type:complete
MIEKLKDLEEVKDSDAFVLSFSTVEDGKIVTQVITNRFTIGNLPIVALDVKKNVEAIYDKHHQEMERAGMAT